MAHYWFKLMRKLSMQIRDGIVWHSNFSNASTPSVPHRENRTSAAEVRPVPCESGESQCACEGSIAWKHRRNPLKFDPREQLVSNLSIFLTHQSSLSTVPPFCILIIHSDKKRTVDRLVAEKGVVPSLIILSNHRDQIFIPQYAKRTSNRYPDALTVIDWRDCSRD
ncbi:hypothetical protein CEXT_550611 [Caerostris extrusa]|uniref:Uncharacterized protein n=1 Tax=Caerostris extrusa TaxID=172846 RepID=A0AAV4RBE7_CAEEX|nr:hypothetical protein CEXT_550611 [Caerostris extrusa]